MTAKHGTATAAGTPQRRLFVNRTGELAELRAALAGVADGRGKLFLITGEAGIGKTELAGELQAEAHTAGALTLWGAAWEGGGAPAYWPWIQVVRGLGRRVDAARLPALAGRGAGLVAHLVPELREPLGHPPAPTALDGEQARFSLFDALTSFLLAVSRERPLVLVLDDLHAADESSLLLLEFLALAVRTAPVLLVGMYRDEEARARPELAATLSRLGRAGRRLPLAGLAREEMSELVESHVGPAAGVTLLRRLHELTDGNPFFAGELSRLLAADPGLAGRGALPLPDTVRETIRRRLDPLPDDVVSTLTLAAVMGPQFPVDVLAEASGLPAEELLGQLDLAARAGIVAEAQERIGAFRFVHALMRETLYDELPTSARVHAHRQVAEALERRHVDDEHLSELAHHFVQAATGGQGEQALRWSERAAGRALAMLAYEQAEHHARDALRALELDRPDEERRCHLLLLLGDAQMRAGRIGPARATLNEAWGIAGALDAPELTARAALGASPWGLSLNLADEELVRMLEDALSRLGDGDSPLRARVLSALAVALYWSTPQERRLELAEEAIAVARRAGDEATLARVLGDAHIATWDPDSPVRSMPWAEELLAVAARLGDAELALHAHTWRTMLLVELGRMDAVDESIATCARLADELRQPRAQTVVLRHRAMRAAMEGRFAEAESLVEEQGRIAGELPPGSIDVMLLAAQTFGLRWVQGRLAELEPAVRHIADMSPQMPVWRCALMVTHRQAGRAEDVRATYERLAASRFAALPRDNLWLIGLSLAAEACADVGDAEGAAALLELLEPYATRMLVTPGAVYFGPVARACAMLATTLGDFDAATRHLATARKTAVRMRASPMLALLALDEARMLAARGGPGDAQAAAARAAEARALAAELGLDGVRSHADALGAGGASAPELAAEPPPPAPRPAAGRRELHRQGEVWSVTANGSSFVVRDVKGLHHLAALLPNPGVELHALDLVGGTGAGEPPGGAQAAADAGLTVRRGDDDAGPLLDEAAKAAYRARVEELRADIEEARRFNDPERAARAQEELELVARELSSAVGLGGRDRRSSSTSERARVNVTRAIKAALDRIAAHDEELAQELRATVRTGTFCSYRPLGDAPAWLVRRD